MIWLCLLTLRACGAKVEGCRLRAWQRAAAGGGSGGGRQRREAAAGGDAVQRRSLLRHPTAHLTHLLVCGGCTQRPQLPQARKLSGHAPAHAPLSLRRGHQAQHRSCQSRRITSPHDFVASMHNWTGQHASHMPTGPLFSASSTPVANSVPRPPEQVKGVSETAGLQKGPMKY